MVASKQNDILTLLNLACIKHTGCPLPVSDYSANNWKKPKLWTGVRRAVWSPHPYFNPIHLYYPSYDFGARVLRSLVVAEIDFILNGERKLREQILKLSNPFNYPNNPRGWETNLSSADGCSREYKDDVITFQLHFTSPAGQQGRGKPSRLKRLFLKDGVSAEDKLFPQKGMTGRWTRDDWNKHHPRTMEIDKEILRNKCNRIRWRDRLDIWTKKGQLRKSDSIVEDIYDARMLAIGMSSTSDRLFFKGFQVSHSQLWARIADWSWKGCSYHQLLKGHHPKHRAYGTVMIDKTPLTPEDYVEIFGEKKEGQRKEKIDKALIANFPLTQSV